MIFVCTLQTSYKNDTLCTYKFNDLIGRLSLFRFKNDFILESIKMNDRLRGFLDGANSENVNECSWGTTFKR